MWCVAWSAHSEYELLSGDGGGQVRVWDVRRAGCRAVLDQYATAAAGPAGAAAGGRLGGGASAEEPPPLAVSPAKKRRAGGAGEAGVQGMQLSEMGSNVLRLYVTMQLGTKAKLPCYGTFSVLSAKTLCSVAVDYRYETRSAMLTLCPHPTALPHPVSLNGSTSAPALLDPSAGAKMKESAVKAHSGGVTCVLPCPNTPRLLTAGTDGRMRLWDSHHRNNRLVGYEGTHNRALRARQLAVTDDSRIVFYPTGSSINVYDVETGHLYRSMQQGHTDTVNCCAYNPSLHELYSGSNDRSVGVWVIGPEESESEDGGPARRK